MELARQYGGYGGVYGGGGYGGYVECCEGVVDPILLLGVIVGNYYIQVSPPPTAKRQGGEGQSTKGGEIHLF